MVVLINAARQINGDLPPLKLNPLLKTTSRQVSLYLYGEGWAEDVRLQNDDEGFGPWQPFQSGIAWTLSTGDGSKTVTVELRRGNEIRSASDSITLSEATHGGGLLLQDNFD